MSAAIEVGVGIDGIGDAVTRARAAEAAGFDHVFCGEHVFFHGPAPNGFVALAAAAGATERIKLLTSTTLVPLYPPALLAKLASSLDVVSGGRFNLGVGVGGEYPPEFAAVGVPVEQRGSRTNEALEAIRLLFGGERVSFSGRHTSFTDVKLDPRPRQPGGPPIWVAGRGDAAIRRAARHGDVWMPYMYTPERLADSLEQVRAQAREYGRTTPVDGAIYLFTCVDEDGDRARARVVESVGGGYQQDFSRLGHYLLAGTPDECLARLREYADAGARRFSLQLSGEAEAQEETLGLLVENVVPALRAATSG
jgi:probable F420-dependent oxidoreductase